MDELSTNTQREKNRFVPRLAEVISPASEPCEGIWEHAGMLLIVALTAGLAFRRSRCAVDDRSRVCSRSETRRRGFVSYDASIESENMRECWVEAPEGHTLRA